MTAIERLRAHADGCFEARGFLLDTATELEALQAENDALRDAFRPVESWYDADCEIKVTFREMLAAAVADLQDDRNELLALRCTAKELQAENAALKKTLRDMTDELAAARRGSGESNEWSA